MSKHVFLIVSDMGLGGIQKKILDVAQTDRVASGKDSTIFHCIYRDTPTFFDLPQSPHFRFHQAPRLPVLRRFKVRFFDLYLWYMFVRYRPRTAVFFLHHFAARVLEMKRILRVFPPTRLIVSQDTILSSYNSPEHSSPVYTKKEIQRIYSQVESILVQTSIAKQDLVDHFSIPAKKIKVLPNWVPTMFNSPDPNKRTIDIVYFGRFEPQKRVDVLLNVIKKVVTHRPETNAVLIGGGSELEKIRVQLTDLNLVDSVQIIAATPHVQRYLGRSKVFALTSDFEGFPMAVLEAMAMGVVPVVMPFPGVHEHLQHGVDGFIETSVASMSRKITALLNRPAVRKAVAKQAMRKVKEKYGDQVREQFIDFLLL